MLMSRHAGVSKLDSTQLTQTSLSPILRLTISRQVLSWNEAPIWGLRPDFYYPQPVAGLLMWGALSDKRAGLSPAQSFSGTSPVGPMIIFSSLRFETSLFVASYDSLGYGGGIRTRLQTGTNSSLCNSSSRTTQKTQPLYCCARTLTRECVYRVVA
jgi:hypothetical protein